MNYKIAKAILNRKPSQSRGFWSTHICFDCDCNFQIYSTCVSGADYCPNCKSDNIGQIRTNEVKNGDLNRISKEFVDMVKFGKFANQKEKKVVILSNGTEGHGMSSIRTCGSLDCCKDPNCKLCHGTGYLIPKEKKVGKEKKNDI